MTSVRKSAWYLTHECLISIIYIISIILESIGMRNSFKIIFHMSNIMFGTRALSASLGDTSGFYRCKLHLRALSEASFDES